MPVKQQNAGQNVMRMLHGMITDTQAVGAIADVWQPRCMVRSKSADMLGQWCVDYYREFGEAPCGEILGLYEQWQESSGEEDKLVMRVLENVNTLTPVPTKRTLAIAELVFKRERFELLQDKLDSCGDPSRLPELMEMYGPVRVEASAEETLFGDGSWIAEEDADILIECSGALGKFFGHQLARENFVSFLAPSKRGKSFWLMRLAVQALKQHRRVMYFEAGDLSKRQTRQRFLSLLTKHPIRKCKVTRAVKDSVEWEAGKVVDVELKERLYDGGLRHEHYIKGTRLLKHWAPAGCKGDSFRLSCHPSGSLTVDAIRNRIVRATQSGWLPDVIVIDYADILGAPPGKTFADERGGINHNWMRLRSIALEFGVLVLTATQGDAASFSGYWLGPQNFSNDKRKLDHVTGMVGINATDREMTWGLNRLNWVLCRSDDASPRVWSFGSRKLSDVALWSTFPPKPSRPEPSGEGDGES